MNPELADTTALITGGGTGIGRATALALAADGCTVTVTGRTERTLAETVEQIEAAGGKARYAVTDVSDEGAVQHAVRIAIGDSRPARPRPSTARASAAGTTSSRSPSTPPRRSTR